MGTCLVLLSYYVLGVVTTNIFKPRNDKGSWLPSFFARGASRDKVSDCPRSCFNHTLQLGIGTDLEIISDLTLLALQ